MNQVNNKEKQAVNNIDETERIELPREELTEEDHDLNTMFITQLENLAYSSLLQIEPRVKLPKEEKCKPSIGYIPEGSGHCSRDM